MRQLTPLQKQAGIGALGWLMMIGLILTFVIIGLKLVPVYLENHSIQTVLDEVAADPVMRTRSAKQIRQSIIKRLKINNIYSFDASKIVIKRTHTGYDLVIAYEVRDNLYHNLDFVATFENKASL